MEKLALFLLTFVSLPYSLVIFLLAKSPVPKRFRGVFRYFGQKLGISLENAKIKEWEQFSCFMDIFIREPEQIKLQSSSVVSPCQGTVYQVNGVGMAEPVKARYKMLIKSVPFRVSSSIGIYLSPQDFHRVYSPVDGTLLNVFNQGWLLSTVNPQSKLFLPSSLYLNKRTYLYFDSSVGRVCLILVGAVAVGRIIFEREILNLPLNVHKGDQLARFELGSFVWLLIEENINLKLDLVGAKVCIGEALSA